MITIQREHFTDIWREGLPLMAAHHEESGELPGALDLNLPVFLSADQQGILILVTARDDGVLVGYSTCWHGKHPHVKSARTAQGNTIYVHPDYRGQRGLGYKILKHMITELKASAPMIVKYGSKVKRDIGPILKRLGFQADEVSYTLTL